MHLLMRELDRLFELFDDFFLLLLGSLLLFNILCVHLEIKKSAQCLIIIPIAFVNIIFV